MGGREGGCVGATPCPCMHHRFELRSLCNDYKLENSISFGSTHLGMNRLPLIRRIDQIWTCLCIAYSKRTAAQNLTLQDPHKTSRFGRSVHRAYSRRPTAQNLLSRKYFLLCFSRKVHFWHLRLKHVRKYCIRVCVCLCAHLCVYVCVCVCVRMCVSLFLSPSLPPSHCFFLIVFLGVVLSVFASIPDSRACMCVCVCMRRWACVFHEPSMCICDMTSSVQAR